MKKIVMSLLCLFLLVNTSIAGQTTFIPDELSVHEHWISLTKSYDIETNSEKLGTLYRRFFSLLLTYDFYDPMDIKTATAKARFFSFGAYLDIYDQNNVHIGAIEEKIFNFFPTFVVLGPNSTSKLARAEMNFWGTKFYIYDTITNQEMAVMTRPFFRFKNDWTIKVTNRNLLDQKNIDPRVLMTVLAVQGEIEDWKKDNQYNGLKGVAANTQPAQTKAYDQLTQQIADVGIKHGLDKLEKSSEESLELLADELDQGFNAANQSMDDQNLNNDEQIKAFTTYCLNLISSHDLTDTKKKAILTLLHLRLQGHN